MLKGQTYDAVYRDFRWKIPKTYNIGVDVCDKWASGSKRLALIYVGPDEKEQRFSFQDLKALSNRLSNALRANGVEKSDRVGILLPQCPETLISPPTKTRSTPSGTDTTCNSRHADPSSSSPGTRGTLSV